MLEHSPYRDAANAAAYDRLALPHHFSAPARDLVDALRLAVGDVVLDVGSGTGAAAIPAAEAVGPKGMVVAIDASPEMLQLLRRKGVCEVAAGEVPHLPCRDGSFHAVMGNFVVSHFRSYEAGLADMLRVLHAGGRLGVTTWAAGRNPFGDAWSEVAVEFLDQARHQQAFREIIPWDEWFSQDGNLQRALEDAGLIGVAVNRRAYRIAMDVGTYLSVREAGVEGTILRRSLEGGRWHRFRRRAADVFRSRFGDTVEYDRDVYVGIGCKRGGI